MIVYALSKKEIEWRNMMTVPHVIISVYSPNQDRANCVRNAYTKEVLFLEFHDADQITTSDTSQHVLGPPVLFSEAQALKLVAVLYQHNPQGVVCQCEAGQSRSAGLAAAISKYFNGDDSMFFGTSSMYARARYTPNRFVYSMLLATLHNVGSQWESQGKDTDTALCLWAQIRILESEDYANKEALMYMQISPAQVHAIHQGVLQARAKAIRDVAEIHRLGETLLREAERITEDWHLMRCKAYLYWFERQYNWEIGRDKEAQPRVEPRQFALEYLCTHERNGW